MEIQRRDQGMIKKAWCQADIIEVSRQELEFLLDYDYYEGKRNYYPQYFVENYVQTRNRRDCHHYMLEEIFPLWHDKIKLMFVSVSDGTLNTLLYYAPIFDGVVVGMEDVLITPSTSDRTGSGDAVVASSSRKLTTHSMMYTNQERLLRKAAAFQICYSCGIIAQWTIGAVRGIPIESTTQNLKELVYLPLM